MGGSSKHVTSLLPNIMRNNFNLYSERSVFSTESSRHFSIKGQEERDSMRKILSVRSSEDIELEKTIESLNHTHLEIENELKAIKSASVKEGKAKHYGININRNSRRWLL